MEPTANQHLIEIVELVEFDKNISQKEIEDFLKDKNIKYAKLEFVDLNDKQRNVKIHLEPDALSYTELDLLKGQTFPKHEHQIFKVKFSNEFLGSSVNTKPKADEEIEYIAEFDKLLYTEYERKLGSDSMVFTNQEVIDKQRAVAGYLVKKIGLNLIKGRSIMNISLPINIFDTRTILELFVWQNAYAAILLEQGGLQKSPLEKIKYTTCFAMTKFHLSGAQLKPFNPILGETFQAKVLDSNFFLEQTSHHPPILNFFGYGKNYKIYGHNESEAATGANSVKIYYKGNFFVLYPDGTKHKIVYPDLKLTGTMVGSRQLKFRGKLLVIDEKNDLLVHVELDPDNRSFFKKMTSSKKTFPDYVKGVVTSISKNAKWDKKEETYNLVKEDKHIISELEGDFTDSIRFDNVAYWKYGQVNYPKFKRMGFTLPSDSTFREDVYWLKKNNEDLSQVYKIRLEEIQRNDKRLREGNTLHAGDAENLYEESHKKKKK